MIIRKFTLLLLLTLVHLPFSTTATAQQVVAFWGFGDEFDFNPTDDDANDVNFQDFAADIDNTVSGNANLQGYLGNAGNFDQNGGGGFSYTSSTSGQTFGGSRDLKFNDARGGGDDFSINGNDLFDIDRNDGAPVTIDDNFGNDALLYFTFDGSGFTDFQLRFDVEGTPNLADDPSTPDDESRQSLPESFDIFYRLGGSGTWFREEEFNNIPLNFVDLTPPDEDNQIADTGLIALFSQLDNQSQIELLINDFAESNDELEIDNVELIGTAAIPEPSSAALIALAGCIVAVRRRNRR